MRGLLVGLAAAYTLDRVVQGRDRDLRVAVEVEADGSVSPPDTGPGPEAGTEADPADSRNEAGNVADRDAKPRPGEAKQGEGPPQELRIDPGAAALALDVQQARQKAALLAQRPQPQAIAMDVRDSSPQVWQPCASADRRALNLSSTATALTRAASFCTWCSFLLEGSSACLSSGPPGMPAAVVTVQAGQTQPLFRDLDTEQTYAQEGIELTEFRPGRHYHVLWPECQDCCSKEQPCSVVVFLGGEGEVLLPRSAFALNTKVDLPEFYLPRFIVSTELRARMRSAVLIPMPDPDTPAADNAVAALSHLLETSSRVTDSRTSIVGVGEGAKAALCAVRDHADAFDVAFLSAFPDGGAGECSVADVGVGRLHRPWSLPRRPRLKKVVASVGVVDLGGRAGTPVGPHEQMEGTKYTPFLTEMEALMKALRPFASVQLRFYDGMENAATADLQHWVGSLPLVLPDIKEMGDGAFWRRLQIQACLLIVCGACLLGALRPAVELLLGALTERRPREHAPRAKRKVCLLFAGEGECGGAARLLYRDPDFKAALDRCGKYLPAPVVDHLLDGSSSPTASATSRLGVAQPALFALEYSLAQALISKGVEPEAVLGHSVGEYTAACVGGQLALHDACAVVEARGRLLESVARGQMVAAFASPEDVQKALIAVGDPGAVGIAALNGPLHCVISGSEQGVQAVCKQLALEGVKTQPLGGHHAFHSPLMRPVLPAFRQVAEKCKHAPDPARKQIPLASTVEGGFIHGVSADYWVEHLTSSVQLYPAMQALEESGVTTYVEVGPGSSLAGIAQSCVAPAEMVPAFARGRELQALRQCASRLATANKALSQDGIDALKGLRTLLVLLEIWKHLSGSTLLLSVPVVHMLLFTFAFSFGGRGGGEHIQWWDFVELHIMRIQPGYLLALGAMVALQIDAILEKAQLPGLLYGLAVHICGLQGLLGADPSRAQNGLSLYSWFGMSYVVTAYYLCVCLYPLLVRYVPIERLGCVAQQAVVVLLLCLPWAVLELAPGAYPTVHSPSYLVPAFLAGFVARRGLESGASAWAWNRLADAATVGLAVACMWSGLGAQFEEGLDARLWPLFACWLCAVATGAGLTPTLLSKLSPGSTYLFPLWLFLTPVQNLCMGTTSTFAVPVALTSISAWATVLVLGLWVCLFERHVNPALIAVRFGSWWLPLYALAPKRDDPVAEICELVVALNGGHAVTAKTRVADCGLQPVGLLSFLGMLQSRLAVTLSIKRVLELETIQDLADAVAAERSRVAPL